MKNVAIVLLLTGASLACKAQSTPEYQYAIIAVQGRDWNIYYEDSTRHLDTGVGGVLNKEWSTRMFKAFHYLNQQGYELISCGGGGYYFKRPKRK